MAEAPKVAPQAKSDAPLTPETTDVPPLYFAIVSPDDPRAVMDLVAMVPASATSTEPSAYRREDKQWVLDDQVLKDLKSATPPPVVALDSSVLDGVLKQVDGIAAVEASLTPTDALVASMWSPKAPTPEDFFSAEDIFELLSTEDMETLSNEGLLEHFVIQAAGGLDRNRGNAEQLRRYWTKGKGAAKIRWGTPGDWTRCVRQLSKYMGPRAKGYCQLRHKEVTGVYTGSRLNPGVKGSRNRNQSFTVYNEDQFIERVVEHAALNARAAEVRNRFALTAASGIPTVGDTTVQGVKPSMEFGAEFSIPLVLPEDYESGDKRKFKPNAVEIRELPLPLLWQIKTADGHQGSVVVGRIDFMERIEGGIGNARGVFDTGEYGKEAERLVRNGFLRGVSADLDQFEAKEAKLEISELQDDDEDIEKKSLLINHARVMAITIVPKPAFQECVIMLVDGSTPSEEEEMNTEDGLYEESIEPTAEQTSLVASGFLTHPIPVTPPRDWFLNPGLDKPTPLTIDDSGRVYGHIAAWHVNHIGMPRATKPPRSRSKYAYFHTGVCRTDDGKDIPVGQLTLAGGHAPLQADANAAARHYDDTASAIADVHAGEDAHGIWVAGSLRPEATEGQIRALRASAPSGDWRPVGGSLELVAVCQVNVPGFPIARAMVAGGQVMALVAAGAHEMAMLRTDISSQLSAKARLYSELNSSVDTLDIRGRLERARIDAEFGYIPRDEREKLAEKGIAMPNGSYPIRNVEDLKNAIQAYGRSKESDRAKVRKHIAKRANALKVRHMVPEEWKSLSSMEAATALSSMRDRIASLTAAAPVEEISDEDLELLEESKAAADKERQEAIDLVEAQKSGESVVDTYGPDGRLKYTPKTQPRDARGKFRKVLARLKQDLGVAGLQKALVKVQAAEDLEFAGNYAGAAEAASDLINTIDRLDTGALDATKLENVRNTAGDLGRVIANLPLPFTNQAQKVRYSDLPPALKNLMDDMITRVESKIGKKDADIATANLRSFKSGADVYSQSEISSQMTTLLRLLT
jgi:hypothetical protein